jgi:hypothetical protein
MNTQYFARPLKSAAGQSDPMGHKNISRKNAPVAVLSRRELRRIVAEIIG